MCIFVFLWVSLGCVQQSPACPPPPPSSVLPLPIVSLPGHVIKLKIMFTSIYSIASFVPYFHLKIPISEIIHFFFKEDLKFYFTSVAFALISLNVCYWFFMDQIFYIHL